MKKLFFSIFLFASLAGLAQPNLAPLTVEKIMRDPRWIGSSPSNPQWAHDGSLYFSWNPDRAPADSLYGLAPSGDFPVKAGPSRQAFLMEDELTYNKNKTAFVYEKRGDIYLVEVKTNKTHRLTQTVDGESHPCFSFDDRKVVFTRGNNLFAWDISSGETWQLTNFVSGNSEAANAANNTGRSFGGRNDREKDNTGSVQEDWLKNDQLSYFQVLRERKEKRDKTNAFQKTMTPPTLRSISIEDKIVQGLNISPDGRFICYRLFKPAAGVKSTIVPNYVTESGYTTDIPGRTKVGSPQGSNELYVYDRQADKVIPVKTDSIAGIHDLPDFVKDYPREREELLKKNNNRPVFFGSLHWSPSGQYAAVEVRSQDNKDRWLLYWDTASKNLGLIDRQRDEAWVDGPGIDDNSTGWIDDQTFWFQSEKTGYSHLYTFRVDSKQRRALTSGQYEVQQAQLSADKKYFYIITNQVHPGEQQFYRLAIATGNQERITTMTGANNVWVSPDEKKLAILYSYSNKPWELFIQENKPGGHLSPITHAAQTGEFKSYPWRDPEVITFTARDGATVYARLYKPAHPLVNQPAVLFVHGAGYLQNAHKYWSYYFREYMFNNLLADNGYYVMDIDYRGSAGYGRDWRTGIYRHMGGQDLDDNVDAANYLVKQFQVDPSRIGLYGGSYGGFITLMGLFTTPDVFKAGAALRPVTDWANYNHGYTSNILNEPFNDSLAYRRSSPFYFAEGLKNHLLICHGMLDFNVHFQDAVKLSQRLIELGKDNWELAPYPMEDHGFVEPSSWTDEYKRIFKLFETVLKR